MIAAELRNIGQWWLKDPKPVTTKDVLQASRPVKAAEGVQDSKPADPAESRQPRELTEDEKQRLAAQGMMNKQLFMGLLGVKESG